MFLSNILLAVVITIIIELAVALALGYRKKALLIITLINIITNPVLNYALWLNQYFGWIKTNIFLYLILEILVILIEWQILKYALKKPSKSLLMLSAVMNVTSFIVGILIYGL